MLKVSTAACVKTKQVELTIYKISVQCILGLCLFGLFGCSDTAKTTQATEATKAAESTASTESTTPPEVTTTSETAEPTEATRATETSESTETTSEAERTTDQTVESTAPIVQVQEGDMAHHGGTPTIRKAFTPLADDPSTTNDESNDQPIGHFGTVTLNVHNDSSGNSYPLDADVNGGEVQRLYFPKGGWVDFNSSEIDSAGNGSGIDEQGRPWGFEGIVDGAMP